MEEKEEIWKPVVDFEEFYEISSKGIIKSKERLIIMPTHSYIKPSKIIKPSLDKNNSWFVRLHNNPKTPTNLFVHKLVAITFIPNPNNYLYIRYKDGDKLNVSSSNLEWSEKLVYHKSKLPRRKCRVNKVDSLPKEEWRDIPEYEGLYKVSSIGRLMTLERITNNPKSKNIHYKTERLIKPNSSSKGYFSAKLYKGDGTYNNVSIHRLVALAFIPNPYNLSVINHKNGIKTDNRIENLEWCTHQYNMIHMYENGLRDVKLTSGENNHSSKLNNEQVINIRKEWGNGESLSRLSKKYGVAPGNIDFIVKRKTWKHI